jgi:hypothetical protein
MIEEIISARAKTHGDFSNVAHKAQTIKTTMFACFGGCSALSNLQREALEMIATKIARICCGNPSEREHWDDIAGYATLISKSIGYAPASKA